MNTITDVIFSSQPGGKLGLAISILDTFIRTCCAMILWCAFFAMLLPTFVNAVLRYTMNTSLVWSVEIVLLVFPWFIMAGAVMAAQHGRHIGVEFFIKLWPMKISFWVSAVIQTLILLSCIAVLYVYLGFGVFEGGMEFAAGDVEFTSIGVSQSWSYLALLVGYAFLGLTTISTLYRLAVGEKGANPESIA